MNLLNDYINICRLQRPIGIWLLLFPGLIGLSLSPYAVPFAYWILFLIGAVAMRSAGCIINDIIDRPFDGSVSRTKARPLVRINTPLSLKWALIFLAINVLIGFICLLQFNHTTITVGFITALMICVYPWMKRITYWPQLFLGFTMNMGFIIGCTATETLNLGAVFIYGGMIFWTLGYDTIYGFQDIEDDVIIGVKSSSIKLRQSPKILIFLMYAGVFACWGIAGNMLNLDVVYYSGMCIIALLLMWQVVTLNIHDPSNCLSLFKINQWVGIILWIGILRGRGF